MDLVDRNKKVRRRNSRAIQKSRHARRRLIYSHHTVRPQVSPDAQLLFYSSLVSLHLLFHLLSQVYHQRFSVCLFALYSVHLGTLSLRLIPSSFSSCSRPQSWSTYVIHSPHPVIRQRFPRTNSHSQLEVVGPHVSTKLFPFQIIQIAFLRLYIISTCMHFCINVSNLNQLINFSQEKKQKKNISIYWAIKKFEKSFKNILLNLKKHARVEFTSIERKFIRMTSQDIRLFVMPSLPGEREENGNWFRRRRMLWMPTCSTSSLSTMRYRPVCMSYLYSIHTYFYLFYLPASFLLHVLLVGNFTWG